MKTKLYLAFLILLNISVFNLATAQTNSSDAKLKKSDPAVLDVDKVVEYPEKFKGRINVAGRAAKIDVDKKILMLGCEDACVAMPVKFSGTMPKVGSDVIVRGQIRKDAQGRYLFEAESVSPKK